MRLQERRAEVWYAGMLSRIEKPPTLKEFAGGKQDKRQDFVACIGAWDKLNQSLARNH